MTPKERSRRIIEGTDSAMDIVVLANVLAEDVLTKYEPAIAALRSIEQFEVSHEVVSDHGWSIAYIEPMKACARAALAALSEGEEAE